VFSRSGVPRPASSGPLSVVIVGGSTLALAVAGILAWEGDPLGDAMSVVAVALGGVAGVLGGGPIAIAILDLADPTTGPPDGVKTPAPPAGPIFDPQRPGPQVPPTLVPPGPPGPATSGADPDTAGAVPTQPVATSALPPGQLAHATMAVAPAGPADPRLLRGGLWIGVLERTAVVGAVLTGFTEGIALLLVIKGVGRYPELSQPTAAERFIIGTLVSILWATACAGVTVLLVR
jgi:hypothetical protein